MKTFNQYFTDVEIIRSLCHKRIKLAKQRHENQYVARLVGSGRPNSQEDPLNQLLPPRKVWSAYRPPYRQNNANVDLKTLEHATFHLRDTGVNLPWVERLNQFIHRVQQRIQDPQFRFNRPINRWKLKEDHKYRALTIFDLEANLICGLAAKYITDYVDPVFESSSYAFRARPQDGRAQTYHDAFESIYNHRRAAAGRELYVAECDIRGFFDCVDHGVALSSLQRVVSLREEMQDGSIFNPQAQRIFQAYLDCFSFPVNVLQETTPILREEDPEGYFPWPADALRKHHRDPHAARIGVPQGGALSCVIANLVLDAADKRMKNMKTRIPELLYIRYCDDMVLIAPDQQQCEVAYKSYLRVLDALKLPYHQPRTINNYDASFWADGMKSKAPYCWHRKVKPSNVPWVQFVGYQIRYDGLVRPKRASIVKHIDSMREKVDTVKHELLRLNRTTIPRPTDPPPVKCTRAQAVASMTAKLVSCSVGRVDPEHPQYCPLPMCWTAGFKALNNKPIAGAFLKELDSERERQIWRFKRADIHYNTRRVAISRPSGWRDPKGYLYSYHAQYTNNGGAELVRHP